MILTASVSKLNQTKWYPISYTKPYSSLCVSKINSPISDWTSLNRRDGRSKLTFVLQSINHLKPDSKASCASQTFYNICIQHFLLCYSVFLGHKCSFGTLKCWREMLQEFSELSIQLNKRQSIRVWVNCFGPKHVIGGFRPKYIRFIPFRMKHLCAALYTWRSNPSLPL